jgi:hypothetical protein
MGKRQRLKRHCVKQRSCGHLIIADMGYRIGFLGILLFATSNMCWAQKTEVEVLLRPSLASLRGNPTVINNLDPSLNLTYGLSANFNLIGSHFLTTTLLYEDKSIRGKLLLQSVQGVETLAVASSFRYLTLPVQWGYRFGKKVKYHFGAGIYASYLIRAASSQESPTLSFTDDETDRFHPFDFGFSTSFKAYIPLSGKINALVGVDDNLGIFNVSAVPVVNGASIRHNSVGLLVGLNVGLY